MRSLIMEQGSLIRTFYFLFFLQGIAYCATFPEDFAWGVSTAAYQIEGAWNVSDKGLSIWDVFSHIPGRIQNNDTGDVGDDFYHKYPEDIKMMQNMGIKNFRLSFSWARILPNGTIDQPSADGIAFYNNVLTALLEAGIEPYVTLYHWDLPQALNDKTVTGGWLNPNIPNKFNEYADFCFKTFGDKVKFWLTFNEISCVSWLGYGAGVLAPGRCSPNYGDWCQDIGGGGNSSTEPYIVNHRVLLAHGLAVKTYKTKYQSIQGGKIGLTINSEFALPYDPFDPLDIKAAETTLLFDYGTFADPIVFGDYPDRVKEYVGDRLLVFTEEQKELLKGSYDFLGLNHYSSYYVQHTDQQGTDWGSDSRNAGADADILGNSLPLLDGCDGATYYPEGIRGLLNWIDKRYNHPPIYIFENGASCSNINSNAGPDLNDTYRVNYLKEYVANVVYSIVDDNVDVRGYFVWSIIDNFEWVSGYDRRFGLVYVDFNDPERTRYPKVSALWYSGVVNNTSGSLNLSNMPDVLGKSADEVYKIIE